MIMTYQLGIFNTIQPSQFDESTGMILTNANLIWLQNLRAQYGHEKLNLEFDITNPLPFAVANARNAGMIEVLSFLIEMHHSAVEATETNN